MCSTSGTQLARLCLAIEELASSPADSWATARSPADSSPADSSAIHSRATDSTAANSSPADSGAMDDSAPDCGVAARLAALWAMVADADPELARRLPGYLSAAE
jgi:hypothetical protein